MTIRLLMGMLVAAGTPCAAQDKASSGGEGALPPPVEAVTVPPSKLAAAVEKERTELQAFIEKAKADLDAFAEREKGRLDAVSKRIRSQPWAPADKAKISTLQELLKNSSAELREKALSEQKDDLRATRVKALWTKYKAEKKARWGKFKQDWQRLLTSPPLTAK